MSMWYDNAWMDGWMDGFFQSCSRWAVREVTPTIVALSAAVALFEDLWLDSAPLWAPGVASWLDVLSE